MLLLVLPATLVGAVLLPVFGAVPDGAIVLFSGLGPDAQSQLSVGVGTLAGSTIMLLTIPWGACVALGRVDLAEDGKSALYKQKPRLTKGWSATRTGVQATSDVTANAWIMLATAVSYLVIQGPAWANNMTAARGAALAAFLLSSALFIGYCGYQLLSSRSQEMQKARQLEVRRRRRRWQRMAVLGSNATTVRVPCMLAWVSFCRRARLRWPTTSCHWQT